MVAINVNTYIQQCREIWETLISTPKFIWKNKLWIGFTREKLAIALIGITLLIIFFTVLDNVFPPENSNNNQSNLISTNLKSVGNSIIKSGSCKYIIMLLLQFFIIYLTNKTVTVLTGQPFTLNIKDIYRSTIRSLKVTFRNWVKEILVIIAISLTLGFFLNEVFIDCVKWIVSGYFIGYLFFDSHLQTIGKSINDANSIIKSWVFPALLIGSIANLLFMVTIIGPLVASLLCSVTATRFSNHHLQFSDLSQHVVANV